MFRWAFGDHKKGIKYVSPEDFIIDHTKEPEVEKPKKKQTVEEMKSVLLTIASSFKKKEKRDV